MLHILLTLIKFIGIILASILGLVVLLLCLLLFVPIRYHLSGEKTKEALDGKGQVSWLLKTLCVNIYLKNEDFRYEIRIFGIVLDRISEFFEKISSIFRRKKKASMKDTEKKKNNSGKDVLAVVDKNETEPKTDTSPKQKFQEQKTSSAARTAKNNNNIDKIAAVVKKILSVPRKILECINNIRLTICSICDKIKYWIGVLQEETTKEALNLVKIQLMKLIKHIIPRKIRGNVTFGFEDPATTGQVLAGICAFYPLYYEQINISPDFTQTIFVGDLDVKGRIYLWVLVKIGIRVYFDKNIQYIKNKLGSNSNKKKAV